MTKAEYHRYLASREWALLKEAVRARSQGRCEHCGLADYEETHHLTYERIGNERIRDLLGVCHECHEYLSGKSDKDPRTKVMVGGGVMRLDWTRERWVLGCPVCAHEFSHIRAAFTRKGCDPSEAVVYDGTIAREFLTDFRRSGLTIEIDGECGHSWAIIIQQNKGVNTVEWASVVPSPDIEERLGDPTKDEAINKIANGLEGNQ